ncbi:MAG TPA: response regulator [Bryobacteraceae bacterium]|nr:response regulator [Bryobacteraceae bacterium]
MARILLADDDALQGTLQKRLLEAMGYTVDVARSPVETVRRVEQGGADLIIMDLRFPNANGLQDAAEGLALIRTIRQAGCGLPVIVVSGWPDELYGAPEEQMVSRVMVKPVPLAALRQTISELVG